MKPKKLKTGRVRSNKYDKLSRWWNKHEDEVEKIFADAKDPKIFRATLERLYEKLHRRNIFLGTKTQFWEIVYGRAKRRTHRKGKRKGQSWYENKRHEKPSEIPGDNWLERNRKKFVESVKKAAAEGMLLENLLKEWKKRNSPHQNISNFSNLIIRATGKRYSDWCKELQLSWKEEGLTDRIIQLIRNGLLLKENGLAEIVKMLNDEFFKPPKKQMTVEDLQSRLDEFVWIFEVLNLMKETVKHDLPVEEFLKHCQYIPPAMAKKKRRELTGATKRKSPATNFAAGMGRIASAMRVKGSDRFKLPENSFDKPLTISVKNDRWSVSFLNGVNLGIPYAPLIQENPARRALSNAERSGDAAVIITNLLDMETKKAAGPAKAFRDLMSGRNVNPENLDSDYAPEAERILRDKPFNEMIYQTTEELFVDSMQGWHKVAVTPKNNKPEFSGPIFIVLGYKEEDIVCTAAYWEANYWTRRKQSKLQVEIRVLKSALVLAQRELEDLLEGREPQRRRSSRRSEKELRDQIRRLEAQLAIKEKQLARTIVSNIDPGELKRYYQAALAFVVRQIEEAIPNSRVIGMGTTIVKAGDETIEVHLPKHARVTDTLLSDYTRTCGPKILRSQMASTVVICHPYALNYRMTARENDRNGQRRSSQVFVAPITVDESYLRGMARHRLRSMHPIVQWLNSEQAQAGLMRLEYNNGMTNPIDMSIPFLSQRAVAPRAGVIGFDSKFIWLMAATDTHVGASHREPINTGTGQIIGVTEAVIEMMRRSGLCEEGKLPIHMFVMNDDATHGHHFDNHQQPHPEKMPYKEIERYLREKSNQAASTKDPEELRKILGEVQLFAQKQYWRKGEFWVQDQVIGVLDSLIEPTLDFFNALLCRGTKAGLILKGMSDFSGVAYDSRDIGLIDLGSGNHFKNTVEGAMTEGFIYARHLRARLLGYPRWKALGEEKLAKLVRAPLYSNRFMAWGTVQAPGGYEWALDLRDTVTRMGSWGDTLLGVVRNDLQRGNYSRIMNDRKTVKVYGDKHFFGTVETPYALYHMSGPDVPTDLYGELGFPPNNTGVSFIGLPEKGPDSGPVLIRTLRYEFIRNFFEQKRSFDWEVFLPNPL